MKTSAGARGSLAGRLAAFPPYSYRADPAVPAFPDDKALIVFDGVCVLCSALVRFILTRDADFAFRFTTAQSPLGEALYRHYGLDAQDFATNLLIVEGRIFGKLDTVAETAALIGGPWCLLRGLRLLPYAVADAVYDAVARNRFRLFGRRERCMIPPSTWRTRFLG